MLATWYFDRSRADDKLSFPVAKPGSDTLSYSQFLGGQEIPLVDRAPDRAQASTRKLGIAPFDEGGRSKSDQPVASTFEVALGKPPLTHPPQQTPVRQLESSVLKGRRRASCFGQRELHRCTGPIDEPSLCQQLPAQPSCHREQ